MNGGIKMRAVDIIEKKRDGIELCKEEIELLMKGYLTGEVPDYQISAFLMAVYYRGMSDDETFYLTEIMRDSGDTIFFDDINGYIIDKHSTGGVGDKVTIALVPIFAAMGILTAKLSGKGLGFTGGTIDKLESISGFKFKSDIGGMKDLIRETGIGLMGYSDKIVPLDKKLYALRDVTATVPSIPLIASSIMSKKLAIQSDAIILDVKVGNGAFMKSIEEAEKLCQAMKKIGKKAGREVVAIISDMDEPLGDAVGNSLELIEAIELLKGNGKSDLKYVVFTIAAIGLLLKEKVEISGKNIELYIERVEAVIRNGEALKKLGDFIENCGGDRAILFDYRLLPQAQYSEKVYSNKKGIVTEILAEGIGKAAMILGAGRATKEDNIDHSVGIVLHRKKYDAVEVGDVLVEVFYNNKLKLKEAIEILEKNIIIEENGIKKVKEIIKKII